MKNAYLILSDLHFAWKKEVRLDYTREIMYIFEQLDRIASCNESEGYTNILIILGDFFDRGFSDSNDAMTALTFTRTFLNRFKNVYAVVGNHELTYYKNNPFWFLISEIQDEELCKQNSLKQPKGLEANIKVVDRLIDGNVVFSFNHFGSRLKLPLLDKPINIGLFHQNIASKEIVGIYGKYLDIDNCSELVGYDYLFLGHIHSNEYYGKYQLDSGGIAYYLASLGRPNVLEVDDRYLERNIPVIKINSGELFCIEDNKFNLLSRSESVFEDIVQLNKKTREEVKKRQNIFSSEIYGTSLYNLAETNAKLAGVDGFLNFFQKSPDDILNEYNLFLNEDI